MSFHFPWRHDPHRAERMQDPDHGEAASVTHANGSRATTIVYGLLTVLVVVIAAAAVIRIV
jgi:hypothetical protein